MVRRLFTREEWGALPPKVEYPSTMEPADRVIFTYGINTLPCRTFTECKHILQKLQRNHLRRGMSDIAYNFLIGGDGNAYEGRGWLKDSSTKLKYTPGKRVDIAFIGRHSKSALPLGMLHHANDLVVTGQRKGFINRDYEFLEIVTTIRYRDNKGQRSPKKENITNQFKLHRNEKTGKYEPGKIKEDRFWESPYFNELVPPGVPPPPMYGAFAGDDLAIDVQGEYRDDDDDDDERDDEIMEEKIKDERSLDHLNTYELPKATKSASNDSEAVDKDDDDVEMSDDEVEIPDDENEISDGKFEMSDDDSDGIVFEDENTDGGSEDTDFNPDEAIDNFVRKRNRELSNNVNVDKDDGFNSGSDFDDEIDDDEEGFTGFDDIDYSEENGSTVTNAKGKNTRLKINSKGKAKRASRKCYSYEETIFDNTNPAIDLTEAYRNSLLQKRAAMEEATRQQNEKIKKKDGKATSVNANSPKKPKEKNSKGKKVKKVKVKRNTSVTDDNISDSISDFDSDEVLRFDHVPPKSKEWLESRGLTRDTDRMAMLTSDNSDYKKAFEEYKLSLKKDVDIIFTDEDEKKPKKKQKSVLLDQKALKQYKTISKEELQFIKKRTMAKKEEEVVEDKPLGKKIRGSIKIPRKNKTKLNKGPRDRKPRRKKKGKIYKGLADPDL